MRQSQDLVPMLTLFNWYAWEKRTVNAITNFGEAGEGIIKNIPYVYCQSSAIQYHQHVYSVLYDKKIRIAEKPLSNTMYWFALAPDQRVQ